MDTLSLLRRLSETPGVAGHEHTIRPLIEAEMLPLVDELQSDSLGSLIGIKRGQTADGGSPIGDFPESRLTADDAGSPLDPRPQSSAPRLMLAAHMDEIGLMVTGYQGAYLRLAAVGGIDNRILPGQAVTVHTTAGPLVGLIATRPPSRLASDKRDKTLPLTDLLLDLGLSETETRAQVQIGDVITLHRPVTELRNGRVAGKAMDNRASVATMLLALHLLRGRSHAWDVYAVATVQEEVGLRGAATSAFRIQPHIGIAIDMGYGEQPGLSDVETFPLGKGPSLAWGPNIHPRVHDRLMATARTHEIPVHFEPMPGHSGTDAWAIQVAHAGVATALLSIPTRYMHTPVETLALNDIERTARLLAHFIADLEVGFAQELLY